MNLQDVVAAFRRFTDARPVVVCHPDDEAATRAVAARLPFPPRVVVNRNVPAGAVYGFPGRSA